jgi:hypothetical protein
MRRREMNPITYKTPVLGDEYQMSGCMSLLTYHEAHVNLSGALDFNGNKSSRLSARDFLSSTPTNQRPSGDGLP